MTLKQYRIKAIWKMVYYLVDEAIKIIEHARTTKETENRSGTQFDSYGAAVFYDGKLYYSLVSSDPKKDHTRVSRWIETIDDEKNGRHRGFGNIPAGTGREWAKMYINDIKKSKIIPETGFALVVFNAAFYSGVQEHGAAGKYRILSQVMGDIGNVQSKFKDSKITMLNLPN